MFQNFNVTIANRLVSVRVPLYETDWKKNSSSVYLSKGEFMKILGKPVQVLISASPFEKASFGHIVRIGNIKLPLYHSNTSTGFANQVEKCTCPRQYEGLSCQMCSDGHFHSNTLSSIHPYGDCIKCECNNHSSNCNKQTGMCFDCQHNTVGNYCEICQRGYYGNATAKSSENCKKCPCKALQTVTTDCVQNQNGDVICLNCSKAYSGQLCNQCSVGYFNSSDECIPCVCNGNSDFCDNETGACFNCLHNTIGDNCELCKTRWHGNASIQDCKGWCYLG